MVVFLIKKTTMANTQLDMRKIKQIFRLYTQGVSKREISKRLGVSKNTVKKYIHLLSTSGFTSEELDELLLEDLRLLISPEEEVDNTRRKYLYDLFPEVSKSLKKVGNKRLNNACKRALDYERINYQTVKTILKKRLDYNNSIIVKDKYLWRSLKIDMGRSLQLLLHNYQ